MTNELEIEDTVGTELVNLLKCNICWEFFTEPTILPCGHTFCYTCLQEIGRHTIKNAKALLHNPKIVINIHCPNCRWTVPYKDIQLKKNGVRFNFALNSVKDHIKELKVPKKVDASTNTDTTSLEDAKLKEIESSLDTIFLALRNKGSVLSDAGDAIEEVRNDVSSYYTEQPFVGEKEENFTFCPSSCSQQAQFTTPRASISQSAWAKWQKFCDDKQGALNFKPRTTSSFQGENIVYKAVPFTPTPIPPKSLESHYNAASQHHDAVSQHNDPVNMDPAILSVIGPMDQRFHQ